MTKPNCFSVCPRNARGFLLPECQVRTERLRYDAKSRFAASSCHADPADGADGIVAEHVSAISAEDGRIIFDKLRDNQPGDCRISGGNGGVAACHGSAVGSVWQTAGIAFVSGDLCRRVFGLHIRGHRRELSALPRRSERRHCRPGSFAGGCPRHQAGTGSRKPDRIYRDGDGGRADGRTDDRRRPG